MLDLTLASADAAENTFPDEVDDTMASAEAVAEAAQQAEQIRSRRWPIDA